MKYEDRITVLAPEGIELDYELAGLGSRFIADFIDLVLRLVVLVALIGLLKLLGIGSTGLLIALAIGTFLALFAYDIAFEVWAAGRTPGKRWNGLRVLRDSGGPVSFGPSAVRNVMRIIDIWATLFIAGITSILLTRRNQRLGDLAAGTIVVRERGGAQAALPGRASGLAASQSAGVSAFAAPPAAAGGLDVTAITAAEAAAISDFLARREQLTPEARTRVSRTLAGSLQDRVGGLSAGVEPERLLELILAAKRQ